jgi:HK97 family phage portal protein
MGLVSTLRAEKREHSPWDDYWYGRLLGPAASGIEVTETSALGSTAVWAAVSNIAGTIGSMPITIFRKLSGGGQEPADDHPLSEILDSSPNPWMGRPAFFEALQGHLLTRGNAFAQVLRSNGGRVLGLVPLHPGRVDVRIDDADELVYDYQRPRGGRPRFRSNEILHVRGLSSNGVIGFSPVTLMREAVGLALATERHGARLFANYARPSGLLKHPGKLEPAARKNLKESWQEAHSGDNAHKVALLEEGLEWEAVGFSAEDSQFLQTRELQVVEVARMFNISPNRLHDHRRSTFNNIEHLDIEFVVHTIRPWIIRWQKALEAVLLTAAERRELSIRFNLKALLQGDNQTRSAFYRELFGIGVFSINEIRELEDLNPVEGGDQRFVPVNMVPIDLAGDLFGAKEEDLEPGALDDDEEEPRALPSIGVGVTVVDDHPIDPEGAELARAVAAAIPIGGRRSRRQERTIQDRVRARKAQEKVFRAIAEKLLGREINAARRAIKKEPTLAGFLRWLAEFYGDYGAMVAKAFLPSLAAYAEALFASAVNEVGSEVEFGAEMERFVREYDATLGLRWQLGSSRQLERLARQVDTEILEETILGRLDEWEEKRADKVALKESVQATGAFIRTAYNLMSVAAIWIAFGETCPLCKSMDGRRVDPGEDFLGLGDRLEADGAAPLTARGSIAHPPLHGGCDCQIFAG